MLRAVSAGRPQRTRCECVRLCTIDLAALSPLTEPDLKDGVKVVVNLVEAAIRGGGLARNARLSPGLKSLFQARVVAPLNTLQFCKTTPDRHRPFRRISTLSHTTPAAMSSNIPSKKPSVGAPYVSFYRLAILLPHLSSCFYTVSPLDTTFYSNPASNNVIV